MLQYAKELITIIGAKKVRIVGGYVRDYLLQKFHNFQHKEQDIDLATSLKPHDLIKILAKNNISYLTHGIEHGTITAIFNNYQFEITSLREDIECDGRHAKVIFSSNWQADSFRRDFTINALFMDIDGQIYDYVGGVDDAKKKLIRFIGQPKKRIEEDHLRILRYFRFITYVGYNQVISKKSKIAAIKSAYKLQSLSKERIKKELFSLFALTNLSFGINFLLKARIFTHINLHFLQTKLQNINLNNFAFSNNALINLVALLKNIKITFLELEQFITILKLSNKEKTYLQNLIFPKIEFKYFQGKNFYRKCLYILGQKTYLTFIDLFIITFSNILSEEYLNLEIKFLKQVESKNIEKIPLQANDLLKLKINGQNLGILLKFAEKVFIDNNFSINKEDILVVLKKEFSFLFTSL